MGDRIKLDPRIGDAIIRPIEKQTGRQCHIVLIACPMAGAKLGPPEFVTRLHPAGMENLFVTTVGRVPMAGDRRVEGRCKYWPPTRPPSGASRARYKDHHN